MSRSLCMRVLERFLDKNILKNLIFSYNVLYKIIMDIYFLPSIRNIKPTSSKNLENIVAIKDKAIVTIYHNLLNDKNFKL